MAKSRTAERMVGVEMHYSAELDFLHCSLKIPVNLLYFVWRKPGALKSAPNQPKKQRNSALSEKGASWRRQSGCHTPCHGHRISDSWLQETRPGIHCPQTWKIIKKNYSSLFLSKKWETTIFVLQYHYLEVSFSFKILDTLHRMWKTDFFFLLKMSQFV